MELIDKEKVLKELLESDSHHVSNSRESVLLDRNRYIVRSQPTIEAYTKDEIQKAIDEVEKYICDVETDTIKAQGMAQALDIFEQALNGGEDGTN